MSNNTCPVFKGFISAWNDYPSQDNEGYRPERGSFKCGFYEGYRFAEGEIKQKDARIKELEAEVEYQKNSATNFCKQSQAKNEIIDQLKEREKKLVECVRFYAEGEIKADLEIRPEKRELWSIPDRWAQRSMSDHYAGKCARQTLKELGINNE